MSTPSDIRGSGHASSVEASEDLDQLVWLAPKAAAMVSPRALEALAARGLVAAPAPGPGDAALGPAVIVVAAGDIQGPDRSRLLALARIAEPGRPVLLGSTDNRDVMLDAINEWRIGRVMPAHAGPGELTEAVASASAAMRTAAQLQRTSQALERETERMARAITELREAQGRLVAAERMSTSGRVSSGLIAAIQGHRHTFDRFEVAIRSLPSDPVLARQTMFTFEGIRAILTLLDDVNAEAEGRQLPLSTAVEQLDAIVERALMFCRFDTRAMARRLDVHLDSRAWVDVDSRRLFHAIISLLRAVMEGRPSGEGIEVRTSLRDGHAYVYILDAEQTQAEPVWQTLEGGLGDRGDARLTSPGLRVCRNAVERHGGQVEFAEADGRPVCYRLHLPTAGPTADQAGPTQA